MHRELSPARMSRFGSKASALLFTLALFFAASSNILAQSDNTQLSGFVRDSAGAAIAGAKVVVKSEGTNLERETTTNEEGYYVVSNVSPGFYTVSAEQTGFKRFETTNKKVDPGIATSVDATLEPGEVTETVSVVASTSAVETETSTVGKLVEAKQIEMSQLNGRNPLFLALLQPGVGGGALSGFSFGLTSGGFNINGSRSQDNLITFDGAVAVRTRSNGTSIGVADVDSTQEVQILTANYNAEYGRSAGGQIRIVTRSGTRDFHGTFYEFVRNSAFDANSWGRKRTNPGNQPCDDERFEKAAHCRPDPFRFNQFGYNLNGPVILPFTKFNRERNKLFWLFGQEWVKFRRGATQTLTVPTLAMRNGDFSELLGPNRFFSTPRPIRDPQRAGNCSQTDPNDRAACFPGNIIPANRLSPNGIALLRAFPLPNFVGSGSSNWFTERPNRQDQRKDTLSIDYYPTERHQFRVRLQNYTFLDYSPFPFGGDPGFAPRIFDRPNQSISINWVWTITPTLINEALVAGSRDQVFIGVDEATGFYQRSLYGINYPYIFPEGKEIADKIPTVDGLSGFSRIDGGPYPAKSTGPIYQASNNMTNIRGNHTIKFGGYFERAGQNDFDQINVAGTPGGTNNQNGRFEFSNTTAGGTGTAIANAAIGLFNAYAEIGPRSYTPYRGHMFEWFIQDSWKVSPKLNLNFGLRYSIIQPYYSLWRNMAVFDPATYDPSIAVTQNPANGFITGGDLRSQYNGLVIPGDGFTDAAFGRIPVADSGQFDFLFRGFDKQYSKVHYNNFSPRLGFAYAFNEKTVIRAGVGRFITRLGVSDSVFLGGNPPFQPQVSISNGSVDNPGGRAGNIFPLGITTQDPIFKNPEAWTWNVTFEREIGFSTTVEVGYVGRRGLHAQRERNINQLLPGTRQANPGINPDFLRPYKGYGIIRSTNNDANSQYHGFQVGVTRRFTDGLLFGLAYTLSKSEDDGSEQREVIPNAYDVSSYWGPSNYDRRHVLVINGVYEFPFFRDRSTLKGKLLGGWAIAATSQMQTGTPISIRTGDDFAGVGPGSGAQFWIVNGDPALSRGDRAFSENSADQNFWFVPRNADNTAIFTQPAAGTFNTQRVRNFLYNPGFQNHNLALFKDFFITETQNIRLRFEAFNWVNHPNWSGANTDPRSANFGKVTSKNSERNLQFSIRYSF
ncbi:MAG: Plug and carboxypeptidase regulatory-like domain-containing protein [Acidobacteriota bacterium]|nr:Plug and carboxypeptidase regulatory-like domain-containing protein [Acidobacteriota bacterium]